MSFKRKRRKNIIDELLGGSLFNDIEPLFDEFSGTEYSISVVQTPEGTKVKAKVGKDVDVNVLKRQLQRQYPNAEIEIKGGRKEPLIREISTKEVKEDEDKETD